MKTKNLLFLVPLMTLMGVGTMYADNVAKVDETGYATFADALSNWGNNTTLTLLADVTVDVEITVSNTRTLDLNGYGITQTASDKCLFIVANGGNLTISDSQPNISTHKFNVNAETHKAELDGEGTLSFTGGYLTGGTGHDADGYRGGAILVRNGGTLSITGGTLIGNSAPFGGAVAVQGGSFSMTGGTIIYNSNVRESATNHGGSAVWVQKDVNNAGFTIGGTARIEHNYTPTGSESDTKAQVSIFGSGATCTLSGGTPQIINGGNGANLQLLNGNVAAISGTFAEGANIGVSANDSPRVFTADYATNNTAADPTAYLHSDSAKYVVCYDFTNADAKLVSASGNVAQVSDGVYTERFSTIVGAMTEWSDGRTLTLLADVEITEEVEVGVTKEGSKTVTLNLNGYGITQTASNKCLFSVTSGGTLTISDGAPNRSIRRFSVGTTDHKAVLDEERGSLTFKGGYLTGGTGHTGTPVHGGAIYVEGGSLSITGGTLIGNSAPFGGAVAVQGGSFSMTGGTILYNSNYQTRVTQHGGSAVWVQRDANAQFTLGGTARIEHNYTPLISNTPESAGQIVISGEGSSGVACTLTGGTPKVFNSENGKNLILLNGNVATVTGAFGNGANIGITDSSAPRAFTSGYNTHNSGVAPYNYFKSDDPLYDVILSGSEAALTSAGLATTGLFSVSSTKKVRFATANVPGLVKWKWANDHRTADANGWRVLSSTEWTYLLSSGRTNASDLNNLCTVDGQKGLVILPDNWIQPVGVPEYKPVGQGIYYDKNVYTASEWALMAQSGAVFLPCEGYSSDSVTIVNATDHGAYWSSDEYALNTNIGYSIHFNNGTIDDCNYITAKTTYYSVRLVKDEDAVTMLDEDDEAEAFATKLAAADDYDFAYIHRTMKKDSTLYTLCLPFDVPNVDASPLAGAEIFTFEGGRVGGSTGNERLYLNMKRLEGKRLTQGVPYIIRWAKTSPVQSITHLCFYNIENWDDNTSTATDPGNETVKFHGVYPKAHITGYTSDSEAHYNFFIGANNTLYWPDDAGNGGEWATHKMKGFRAYFYIVEPDPDPDPAPKYRNLQAVWEVDGAPLDSTEDVESVQPAAVGVQKELREEMIVIIIDGKMYDLQGRIVDID